MKHVYEGKLTSHIGERAVIDTLVNALEQLAGRMLVWSAKIRRRRGLPSDLHEMRHIEAALISGNSDLCVQGHCQLGEKE